MLIRRVHKHQHLNNKKNCKREQRTGRKVIHGKKNSRKCTELKGQEKTWQCLLQCIKKKNSNQGSKKLEHSGDKHHKICPIQKENKTKTDLIQKNGDHTVSDISIATLEIKRQLKQCLQNPRILNPTKISVK